MLVVDAHCDTLSRQACRGFPLSWQLEGQVDLPRLARGKVKVQFFAVFVPLEYRGMYLRRALEQIDYFYRLLSTWEGVRPVKDRASLEGTLAEGKTAGVLAVEGGHVLEGSLAVLRVFHLLGVRCLTLTWNGRNELGDGVGEEGGLSSLGKEVVREMGRLGMLVDVAHLSPAGFWDVLRQAEGPIIASHANSRALCDHPRNLTDEQVKALAATGGVIGVTFVPRFIDPEKPTLDRLIDHMEHLAEVGGIDCVGVGSDFDGVLEPWEEMPDAASWPRLVSRLRERGWKEEEIRKVMGENFLRVMRMVWP
ncbi:Membrane dipeptidase [Ammonifex degensii KC4]|uniref:Membrane dipeptidase n=1 Tax=Ammonifex degensii (strain DSM 10501 / KC4) TaxID=429009 RepID=C9R8D9_AMMDK|nr:Membrane dipeptidase [Ammonifex degensii KC4]